MREWQNLEIEVHGNVVPFCPCLGSHLYRVYEDWCKRQGEFRPRPANHFINFFGKQSGWRAGKSEATFVDTTFKKPKTRKMVIPSATAMATTLSLGPANQEELMRERFNNQGEWLTACFFAFENAAVRA